MYISLFGSLFASEGSNGFLTQNKNSFTPLFLCPIIYPANSLIKVLVVNCV